jgi:hypothetical protein
MDFHLQQLSEAIHQYKTGGDAKANYDKIKQLVYTISQGISLTRDQRAKLVELMSQIHSDQRLKWTITSTLEKKLFDKVRNDRRHIASAFYASRGLNTAPVDAINLGHEVIESKIVPGTSLYQWCKWVSDKNGKSLFNPSTKSYTIGNYFSETEVPLVELGAYPLFDLYHANGSCKGHGKQILCKFEFKFEADCLISVARRATDTWNVKREEDGSPIKSHGFRVGGGATQIFIPLTDSQKRLLAENVMFTSKQSSID